MPRDSTRDTEGKQSPGSGRPSSKSGGKRPKRRLSALHKPWNNRHASSALPQKNWNRVFFRVLREADCLRLLFSRCIEVQISRLVPKGSLRDNDISSRQVKKNGTASGLTALRTSLFID